eukprot:334502_1
MTALQSISIYRLRKCWSKLSTADLGEFKQIQTIFNDNEALRKLHFESDAPAVLHINLFLKDFIVIDQQQKLTSLDGKVSLKKILKLYETIDIVVACQQNQYEFKENQHVEYIISQQFREQKDVDEQLIFKLSWALQLKDRKKRNIINFTKYENYSILTINLQFDTENKVWYESLLPNKKEVTAIINSYITINSESSIEVINMELNDTNDSVDILLSVEWNGKKKNGKKKR